MASAQSYKNHTRWDPIFHYVIMPVLLLNFAVSVYWLRHHASEHLHIGIWYIVMSVVLVIVAEKSRSYALKVQNRVIRLEETMRLYQLATPEEMVELSSLTIHQYVALRFASNAELPELARRAVREKLSSKQIKESIVSWRPDNDRV